MEQSDNFHEELIQLFRNILNVQEKLTISETYPKVSNHDMRIIEAIGMDEPKNMSTIAKALKVTVGTLTISMNNLVKKGFVERVRSEKDRRVVYISLTESGQIAFQEYQAFLQEMIKTTTRNLPVDQESTFVQCIRNLDEFYKRYSR